MSFKTKKINIETLSEYLVGARSALGLSIQDVSGHTGIAPKFLEGLEAGKFQGLPATVYVIGFLKKLAAAYEVSESLLIEQFKKERTLSQEISKKREPAKSKIKQILGKIVVTPKFLSLTVGAGLVILTVAYLIFQIVGIYGNPKLVINEPSDSQKISGSAVTVSGETDAGNTLTINNQPILVDASTGKFQALVSLTSGQKDLAIVASNKFSKSTTKKVSVLVDTGTPIAETSVTEKKDFNLTLSFTDQVSVSVTVDGQQAASETFSAGSTKTITAHDKVLLSTSNAGATLVQLNNKSLGALGKKHEILTNVPFSSEVVGAVLSSQDAKLKNSTSN